MIVIISNYIKINVIINFSTVGLSDGDLVCSDVVWDSEMMYVRNLMSHSPMALLWLRAEFI